MLDKFFKSSGRDCPSILDQLMFEDCMHWRNRFEGQAVCFEHTLDRSMPTFLSQSPPVRTISTYHLDDKPTFGFPWSIFDNDLTSLNASVFLPCWINSPAFKDWYQ